MTSGACPITASVLLCHKHVELAITCLQSLQRYSTQSLALLLHDDGSLTDADEQTLCDALHNSKVVRKSTADEQMAEKLRRFPASTRFRKDNLFALKLLDTIHATDSDPFVYCDSDILFFRRFNGLGFLPNQADALFMLDIEHCYSIRSWQLLASRRLSLAKNINAGLICFRRSKLDLDRIEWYLAQEEHHTKPYFVEQTAWAMLGMSVNSRLWDPAQVVIIEPDRAYTDDLVAGHFVARFRHLLPEYLPRQRPADEMPVELRTIPTQRCRSYDLAICETRRVVDRVTRRIFPRQEPS